MRIRILVTPVLAAACLAAPARAQTYDPNYPYCLQIYYDMVHYSFECAYTSMEQCQASASGRNAQCVVNPYFPKTPVKPPVTKPAPRQKGSQKPNGE
jgi:hypothetical protein